jgi:hypothetical protein
MFANSGPSALNFKSFSQSLEHFFLTVRQNNFGDKIPDLDEEKDSKCGKIGLKIQLKGMDQ